jgi:Cys-tRNA(Pro)/Cys-tRNA(Cys) deacylase
MAKRPPTGTPALVAVQRSGIAHTVHAYDHDPGRQDYGLEAAEALGLDPATVFKTLIAEVDGAPVVGIVPVTGQLDLKALAAARGGKRARMMDVAMAERLTGYVAGGISPLGQRAGFPTILDSSAADLPMIYVSAGRRGLDIGLAPDDFISLTRAELAAISTSPPSPR